MTIIIISIGVIAVIAALFWGGYEMFARSVEKEFNDPWNRW